jgi:hypothetical protein
MAAEKKKMTTKKEANKTIDRKEKTTLIVISCVLLIAIIFVSVFLLYPNLVGRPDWQTMAFLDFNDSTWIEKMVNSRVKTTGKAINISSSFVYSTDTAFITYTYASSTNIKDAKQFYLDQIPNSVDNYADMVSKLNIVGMLQGEKIDIVNYEADLLNAYDTKVVLEKDKSDTIKKKLIQEFPVDFLNKFPEIAQIMKNEKLGGYVMYNNDELSNNSYPDVPIFSEAYRYNGSSADLAENQKAIKEKYKSSVYFEDGGMVYFKDQGHIISLSIVESDLNILAVITVQKIPDNATTQIE